jgi:ABC-type Fe3+-hydroxamate transport system substrate-binding protein
MLQFTDQLGKVHTFKEIPRRIVSIVPSQTELLFDLGLEDSIVGITKFCVHPFYLKSTKTIIGGTKKVNIAKIKVLKPDVIIANKEENTIEIVEELNKICPVIVTDIQNIDANLKMISDFGILFNKPTEAKNWIDKINFALADFNHFIQDKSIKKVAYFIWKNPYMVVGKDTFINFLLELNRFENIYKQKGRYPVVEIKKMPSEGNPDLVFLSSEPFPFKEADALEIGRFTQHAKTIFVDGELFSWYGTRLVKSFDYFKQIHQHIE